MVDNSKSSDPSSEDTNKNLYENFMADKPPIRNNSFEPPKSTKKSGKLRNFFSNLTKKQKILLAIIIVILSVVVGLVVWFLVIKPEPKAKVETPAPQAEVVKPATEPSALTGLEVAPEINQRTVTGVMIENSPDARPQSGLKDAGVVYEAIVEGGITRFLAVFQDTQPEYVGPVRSLRPYYLDFLGPYNGAIMHVGGSGEALAQVKAQGIKDLDRPGAYWRESTRYAPHNAYTNIVKLKEIEQQAGYTAAPYSGFVRGGPNEPAAAVTARVVNIKMSSTLYNINYEYDPATNTYKRNEGGKPHMDAKSNTQLTPKVLVVPIVPRSQSGIYSVYAINGSGKVLVFQNGTVTEGTWQKSDRKAQFKFTGADGQPLKLAPGQTWVTLAASAADVTAAP